MQDVTDDLRGVLTDRLADACGAMDVLKKLGYRDAAVSGVMGELSERLVCSFIGGSTAKRGSWGYDLLDQAGKHVEVKARFIGNNTPGSRQFNFGKHSEKADRAFCLLWRGPEEALSLEWALQISMPELIRLWPITQPRYCSRTTIKKLRVAFEDKSDLAQIARMRNCGSGKTSDPSVP